MKVCHNDLISSTVKRLKNLTFFETIIEDTGNVHNPFANFQMLPFA